MLNIREVDDQAVTQLPTTETHYVVNAKDSAGKVFSFYLDGIDLSKKESYEEDSLALIGFFRDFIEKNPTSHFLIEAFIKDETNPEECSLIATTLRVLHWSLWAWLDAPVDAIVGITKRIFTEDGDQEGISTRFCMSDFEESSLELSVITTPGIILLLGLSL